MEICRRVIVSVIFMVTAFGSFFCFLCRNFATLGDMRGIYQKIIERLQNPSVKMGALVLGVSSLLSRVVGVMRDRVLSSTFGAGRELDAYFAAFRVPDMMYNLVVIGAVTAGFIPAFTALLHKKGQDTSVQYREAYALASRLLTFFCLVLGVLGVVGFFGASWFVPLFVHGFRPEDQATTVMLTRVMMLSPIFLGVSAVFGGVLQGMRHFLAFSLAPIFYNVGIIFGTVVLVPQMGVVGVAWGVVIGAMVHALIQGVACVMAGYRQKLSLSFRDVHFRTVLAATGPRIAGVAVTQFNAVVLTGMASVIGSGALTAFTFANNLQSLPVGVLGVSFAVSAFPHLAASVARGDHKEVVEEFSRTVRMIIFTAIPAAVCFIMLRAQIVRVVFGAGKFSWADTIATADTLAYFAVGMFAVALFPLLTRVYFAYRDVVTPLVIGICTVVLERVIAWRLIERGMGAPGLALAVSIASIMQCAVMWVFLRKKMGALHELHLMKSLFVMTISAFAAAFVMQAVKYFVGDMVNMQMFVGVAVQGGLAGVFGIVTYIGVAYMCGNDEAKEIVAMFSQKVMPTAASGIVQEGEKIEV